MHSFERENKRYFTRLQGKFEGKAQSLTPFITPPFIIETSERERRLRELTNNVNLFSEEFSSFSDHGAKQARTFLYLSIVPLAIIAILTAQLLMGAVDLSVKYVKEPRPSVAQS